jgi:integrase
MYSSEKTFPDIVDDYVKEKLATGYRFDKGILTLRRIVAMQREIDHGIPRLSRDVVERWSEKTPWENETNRSSRISVVRGLATFMSRMGYDTYAVPRRFGSIHEYDYAPYIFSERELGLILGSVDRLCAKGISYHAALVFPLVFRLLVGCGLRITETLLIGKKDVDIENGTLLLLNTKNKKERVIPIATSLVKRFQAYMATTRCIRGFHESLYFFPSKEGTAYTSRTAYELFRKALSAAGISHGGKGKGPRLHDLRHTFAVRVLNTWVRDGKNLTLALPYLAIYMGHAGLKASQHYLRLTAEMYPELLKVVEEKYGWVIPEVCRE